ncbi:uncharacterized protein LOC144433437 [Glandiceps talaboti]
MRGNTGMFGVDLLFQIPTQSSSAMYTYQAVNIPIMTKVKQGFASMSLQTEFDFNAQLQSFLSVGWKLVDIFYDSSTTTQGGFNPVITQNSLWFFEKEMDRINDNIAQYEGSVIEYWHKVKYSRMTGQGTPEGSWNNVIVEMGQRGWELGCILQTMESQISGTVQRMKILLMFQRKIK